MKVTIKKARDWMIALHVLSEANVGVSYPIRRNLKRLVPEVGEYEELPPATQKKYAEKEIDLDLWMLSPDDLPPVIPKMKMMKGPDAYADDVLEGVIKDSIPKKTKLSALIAKETKKNEKK